MQRFALALVLAFSAPLLACDSSSETTQLREAPDVPWPSVSIAGQVKSPLYVGELLAYCFAAELSTGLDYGAPTLIQYEDEVADGDDQQPAELCVSWSAHIDVADCVRSGLLELGGEVVE